jgi:hypothetical protein
MRRDVDQATAGVANMHVPQNLGVMPSRVQVCDG